MIKEALEALQVSDVRELKGGGQKAVRLVEQEGKQYVAKVIPIEQASKEALRRAEREVELLRSINDPNVVRVTSDLVELGNPVHGAAWLEEYLDGKDLSELLFRRQWTWSETAKMGLHVARGLAAAHSRAVVHRDLSANNVRCLADGTYKVMDFGFARHTLRSGLTIAGQPGTPGFASPEHLRSYSGSPTQASDIFVVGILMFAALTTLLPIPYNGDDADYARRLHAVELPDLSVLRPDLDNRCVAIVKRCLHRQPARRFLNGAKLADALQDYA